MGAHSHVGASGAYRWMQCPGSVRLSKGMPDHTSEAAAEGTVAHWVGESALREKLPAASFIGETREEDGYTFDVTEEMADAVQVYLDEVAEIRARHKNTVLMVERSFHLKSIHSKAFGTADAVIWAPDDKVLYVIDYKHGAGIPVEAVDNPQGRYYSLGVLLETRFSPDKVVIGIVQPRCPHPDGPVRYDEVDFMDLLDWSADLEAAIEATLQADAPLKAGEWCRFCKAAPLCPELKKTAVEAAKTEFSAERPDYDANELAENLAKVPLIEQWCKSVREFAYREAEAGRNVPGHKLVDKRAVRKWKDPAVVTDVLTDYGLTEDEIYKPRDIKTPPQIEKIIGKSEFRDLEERLVLKESSGHTLVPEDDKRPAAQSTAAQDFS